MQQLQTVDARHVDVRQDEDHLGLNAVPELLQRVFARLCEMQCIIAAPRFTAEPLPK